MIFNFAYFYFVYSVCLEYFFKFIYEEQKSIVAILSHFLSLESKYFLNLGNSYLPSCKQASLLEMD